MDLYRAVFPGRNSWYHLYCAWRQFHSFAATYADRIEMERGRAMISAQGREGFLEVTRQGRGAVLIMSHLGSHEAAARAFEDLGLRLLLLMGEKEARHVARGQREALQARGIHIRVAAPEEDIPSCGLEALQFLRKGGVVSLPGDLAWTDPRSLMRVRLFDREVGLPAGPHLLALVSGAPLFTMFTFRVGKGRHRIVMSQPWEVKAPSRPERNAALQASAQTYAAALEEMVRRHPFQWYIFEPFFERKEWNPCKKSS